MKSFLGFLLAPVLFLSGCSSDSVSNFDIQVSPSKELQKVYGYYPSVEVDVVGVTDEDAIRIKPYPIEKYFEKDNPMRTFLNPVKFKFSEEDLSDKRISSDSEEFVSWKENNVAYIVMIANLPYSDPEMKENDPRKYFYRIPKGLMASVPDLYVKVGATGLIKTTEYGAKDDRPESPKDTESLPKVLDLKCISEKGKKNMECREQIKPPKVGAH